VGLTTPRYKNKLVTKDHKKPRTWTDSLDKLPTNGGEEESIWDIGGNARRKETTRKTKT
jgi:hypothetical protein